MPVERIALRIDCTVFLGVIEVADIDAVGSQNLGALHGEIRQSAIIERREVEDVFGRGDGISFCPAVVPVAVTMQEIGKGIALGAIGGAPGRRFLIPSAI